MKYWKKSFFSSQTGKTSLGCFTHADEKIRTFYLVPLTVQLSVDTIEPTDSIVAIGSMSMFWNLTRF